MDPGCRVSTATITSEATSTTGQVEVLLHNNLTLAIVFGNIVLMLVC